MRNGCENIRVRAGLFWLYAAFSALWSIALRADESSPTPATQKDRALTAYRSAAETLDSSNDTKAILGAMETLRQGFPECRPVLLDCIKSPSVKLKCFALQVLGEQGTAHDDLDIVSQSLSDEKARVRLAAVMALRRLGKDCYKALSEYFPREADSNNKKMAVKTFQVWNTDEAVPLLVQSLEKEKEKTVRNFIVVALEALTRRKLGEDIGAWKSYIEGARLREEAQGLREIQVRSLEREKP